MEVKVMKKILYLHGLESSNVCDKVDFLKERAEVLAPSIDYRKSNIEEELMYMVESFSPDLIIGSSMGGYCGLLLANYYNLDCVVFNPAIHSRPIEPNLKVLPYEDIHYGNSPLVILGLEDDVIDPSISCKIFNSSDFEGDIVEIKGMSHRIPLDIFVDIYNKYIK
jgi:hypothetical protein